MYSKYKKLIGKVTGGDKEVSEGVKKSSSWGSKEDNKLNEGIKKGAESKECKEGDNFMNVLNLSIELSRLNPMLDSKQYEEEGTLYRNVLVEVRSGEESVIRINESVVGEYEVLGKFSKLGGDLRDNLLELIENYCETPVEVRLAK